MTKAREFFYAYGWGNYLTMNYNGDLYIHTEKPVVRNFRWYSKKNFAKIPLDLKCDEFYENKDDWKDCIITLWEAYIPDEPFKVNDKVYCVRVVDKIELGEGVTRDLYGYCVGVVTDVEMTNSFTSNGKRIVYYTVKCRGEKTLSFDCFDVFENPHIAHRVFDKRNDDAINRRDVCRCCTGKEIEE